MDFRRVRSVLDLELSDLKPNDIPGAAQLLSASMLDNPIHIAVYGGAGKFERQSLEGVFHAMFEQRLGEVVVARLEGEMVGIYRSYPCQGGWEITAEVQQWIESNPDSTLDYQQRSRYWRGLWASLDPTEPHNHLGPIAVRVGYQGLGVGKVLMDHYCRVLEHNRQASYLEADKRKNVSFYQRFGYRIIREETLLGVLNTFMWREAQII